MTRPADLTFRDPDVEALAEVEGRVAIFVGGDGKLDPLARRVNRLTKGAVERLAGSDRWRSAKAGDVRSLEMPAGMAAEAVVVVRLDAKPTAAEARRAGAAIGRGAADRPTLICWAARPHVREVALGAVLRGYAYRDQKTGDEASKTAGPVTVMTGKPGEAEAAETDVAALASGVFLTRDLINAPSNVLTTTEFADRLSALSEAGLTVEVLDEEELASLGMRTLLAVGQGSDSPSKVVVMRWDGGGDEPPLALVGKGVVFDTGGISIKPAGGMEDMTMDMGGAGTVAGVMKTLALRKAKANVVGLVGLVENMPDGRAQRPGDVVVSMKGDTVEVINTDAEGRLVLADVLWYAQERFSPAAIIDLATLTGAVIVALGHHNAGVFSTDDDLADAFLAAATAEGEGAWRLPLGEKYAEGLKSRIADVRNVGTGRAAGSVTAAEFLRRFVKEGTPWIHLDIAGTASTSFDTDLAPKGASGWGVLSLDRLIRDRFGG